MPSAGYVAPTPSPAAPAPTPSIFSDPIGAIKNYIGAGAKQAASFEGDLLQHPVKTLLSVPSTFADSIISQARTAYDATVASREAAKVDTGTQAFADRLGTLTNAAKVLLSPITGTFDAAQHYPVLKQAADILGVVPTVSGIAASYSTGKVLDVIPNSIVSPQAKDILRAPLQDAASLAAQVFLGDRIMSKVSDLYAKGKEIITPAQAHDIVAEVQAEPDPHTTATEPLPTQPSGTLYHGSSSGSLATDENRNINFGTNKDEIAQFGMPTAVSTEGLNVKDFPTKAEMFDAAKNKQPLLDQGVDVLRSGNHAIGINPDNISKSSGVPITEDVLNKPINSSEAPATTPPNPIAVTKAASDISDTLVKQGFDALTPEQQSKFTQGSYKESAAQGEVLKNTNLDALKYMATTGENIPDGVHPQILFNIVEALATNEGDVPLLQQLAKSPLGRQLSEGASTMGSHGFNDNPNSVVKRLQQANDIKAGGPKGKAKTDAAVKEAKATITKTASRMIDYDKILDAITC